MTPELRDILLKGPVTSKFIGEALNLSPGRVRALLKEDQATIRCRKSDGLGNVFWLEPEGDFEASSEELAAQVLRKEIQENKNPPAETPEGACPLCQAEADQVQAGPEGSYLGACRTCAACKRTYNVFTKEEIKMAKEKKTEGKRAAPLNPQYKINQRIAAAEQAGGKLVYQRDGRTWLLTKKGVEPKTMTAVEFANEDAASIHKYLGFTPPAPPAKAEKPSKTAPATGGGKTSKGKASAPKAEKVPETV
jgi:hypothetical protein